MRVETTMKNQRWLFAGVGVVIAVSFVVLYLLYGEHPTLKFLPHALRYGVKTAAFVFAVAICCAVIAALAIAVIVSFFQDDWFPNIGHRLEIGYMIVLVACAIYFFLHFGSYYDDDTFMRRAWLLSLATVVPNAVSVVGSLMLVFVGKSTRAVYETRRSKLGMRYRRGRWSEVIVRNAFGAPVDSYEKLIDRDPEAHAAHTFSQTTTVLNLCILMMCSSVCARCAFAFGGVTMVGNPYSVFGIQILQVEWVVRIAGFVRSHPFVLPPKWSAFSKDKVYRIVTCVLYALAWIAWFALLNWFWFQLTRGRFTPDSTFHTLVCNFFTMFFEILAFPRGWELPPSNSSSSDSGTTSPSSPEFRSGDSYASG